MYSQLVGKLRQLAYRAMSKIGKNSAENLDKINKFLSTRPLLLKLETTSICNSLSNFCGYTKMKRDKQVMPIRLFDKVVQDYAAMGGGAIKLTPCAGELLTDPYLPKRFEILRRYKEIGNISFTTNLIAHKKLSDLEWMEILRETYFLQVSLGGLDRNTYIKMFGVDKVETVIGGIERIISLKKKSRAKTMISLAFRTDRDDYLNLVQNELSRFMQNGIYISNIASYGNWGGILRKEDTTDAIKIKEEEPTNTSTPCAVMISVIGVLSSGTVTACACCDMNGTFFPLGNVAETDLSQLYTGTTRRDLLNQMLHSKLRICLNCSFYSQWDKLIHAGLINLENPKNIPLRYYQEFASG